MYARVLYVGPQPLVEADEAYRVCAALTSAGHAVQVCPDPSEGGEDARELSSMCRTFEPTLILWDGRAGRIDEACADVLRRCGCCAVYLTDWAENIPDGLPEGILAVVRSQIAENRPSLSCAPDRRYLDAVASQPDGRRSGIVCTQKRTDARAAQLDETERQTGHGTMASHPSWPGNLGRRFPGDRAAYHFRTARYAVFFEGADRPSPSQVALRVAEGCLVLVGRPLLEQLGAGALEDALVPFDRDGLADTVRDLERDPAHFAQALTDQQAALRRLPDLEGSLARLLEELDARQRASGSRPVLALERPAKHVVVYGWLGAGNYGDDLLLDIATSRIRAQYPEAYFHVMGAVELVIRRDFGYAALAPRGGAAAERALRGACLLLYLGGLVFDDPCSDTAGISEFMLAPLIVPPFQADLALLACTLGVPTVGLGIGGGPIAQPATQTAVRLMSRTDMLFLARDLNSARLFASAGVPDEHVGVYADLALGSQALIRQKAVPDLPDGLEEDRYFVVSLRPWALNPSDFAARAARLVGLLIDRADATAAFVPFDDGDVALHREVAELLHRSGHGNRVVEFEAKPQGNAILSLIRGSRCAVAMRLHCSILHHVLGKPAIGLDYNDKVGAHYDAMGQQDLLLPLDFDDAQAAAAVERLLADPDARVTEIARHIDEAERLVDQAFEKTFALMDAPSGPDRTPSEQREVFYPRTVSRLEQEAAIERQENDRLHGQIQSLHEQLGILQGHLEGLHRENARLTDEVAAVRASHSYRLGNAVMRLPARLKRALARRRHRKGGGA